MTTVNISESWRVHIDDLNHTLEQFDKGGQEIKIGKHKGSLSKPGWKIIGYFPNLQQCLREIICLDSISSDEKSLQEYIDYLVKLDQKYGVYRN